ncbi:hypothetical protein GCM10012319_61650 [Comamonas sp. KCTC 72670]|nr:hypothetical protein GCM10012319_61650 [Comamonas sp. KCTC 72670]
MPTLPPRFAPSGAGARIAGKGTPCPGPGFWSKMTHPVPSKPWFPWSLGMQTASRPFARLPGCLPNRVGSKKGPRDVHMPPCAANRAARTLTVAPKIPPGPHWNPASE